jgi:ABC-2 type transport system permease protein
MEKTVRIMFNLALYRREMKGVWKTHVIIAAVLTLYIPVIISMYDPDMRETLDKLTEMMPGIMDAMGFKLGDASLLGFMASYLYGFILLVCPMIFSILCGHALIAQHVDKGSMVSLLAAPVKRGAIAITQMMVLATGIVILIVYSTILEITAAGIYFPGELDIPKLLFMNAGLLCLHFFIGGICFFCSCLFSEAKYSLGFGAGIPFLMFALQMLGNTGESAGWTKYLTVFTLFSPDRIAAGDTGTSLSMPALFVGAIALFIGAVTVFSKKDLHV